MTNILRDVARSVRSSPLFACDVLAIVVVAVIISLITVNVIDLGMTHFGDEFHRTHDVAFGLLFSTLVVGVLAQLRRPEHNVAAMVMALMPPGALLLTGLLTDQMTRLVEFNPLRYAAALTSVAILLHPTGRRFFRSFRRPRISWPMLALVGVAAVPLLMYASTNITLQRIVSDEHAFMGHYGFMAAISYTVIGTGVLASLRPVGWRLVAWVAGVLPVVLGVTSLLYPDSASGFDPGWAVAVVVWGITFIVVAALSQNVGRPADARPKLQAPQPLSSSRT